MSTLKILLVCIKGYSYNGNHFKNKKAIFVFAMSSNTISFSVKQFLIPNDNHTIKQKIYYLFSQGYEILCVIYSHMVNILL